MVALAGVAMLAGACGKGEGGGSDTGAAAQGGEATSAAGVAAAVAGTGGGSKLQVTLTGGPKAGSYDKTQDMTTCTVGYAGEGKWGNAASDTDDKDGLIGMDLIVDKPAEAKSGTQDFMMTVYMDDRLDPKNQFTIDPKNGKGSGTVTIDDRGATATVTVKGRTAEGVGVDAKVDCNQVLRG